MKNAPAYPGYHAPCNGCGQCCQDQPCAIARQFGLWRYSDGCRALKFRAGRYWCQVAITPERYIPFVKRRNRAKYMPAIRHAIGVAGICDAHRKDTA